MSWQAYAGIAALIAAFSAGWLAHGWKSDSDALLIEKAANAAQLATAEEIKRIEVKNTTIHNKIVERTFHEPVYQDCKHTPQEYEHIKELFKK